MDDTQSSQITAPVMTADEAMDLLGKWDFYLSLVRRYEHNGNITVRVVSWDNEHHDTYFNGYGSTLTEALNDTVQRCAFIGRENYGWAQ